MSSYTDLIDRHVEQTYLRSHLVDCENVAVTIRIPKNLRESAKESASMRGMSFSALIRQSIIEDLASSEKPEFEN